jgi:transposase
MANPLSTDLRSRVVAAVEEGMSRHGAAARFGVSASSAIRWVVAWRSEGRIGAKPQGGDRRSQRIEAHGETIQSVVSAQVDITLQELAALLAEQHGARFAASSVWRFLDRHDLTIKKNGARRRAVAAGRGGEAGGLAPGAA